MACLVTTVMRLRLVYLDDSVGEGPHSAATRIGAASRAPTWGWIESATRMKQNLVEFVSATDEAHLSRQQLWNKYKSVLHRRQQSRVLDRRASTPGGEHSAVAGNGPLALYMPDRAVLEGGQEDPDEGAIVADPPSRRRLG